MDLLRWAKMEHDGIHKARSALKRFWLAFS